MSAKDLIEELFGKGLGDLLILHARQDDVCLGNVVVEKDKLVIRDQGMLSGFKPAQIAPCAETGVLGMVAAARGQIWESLTFYGLKHCDMPVDLSKTRHGALSSAQNQYGESLIDFVGSVYRGYQLMLDHHFLPVILLKELRTKEAQAGLAVCDLRVVPMDLAVIRRINDQVRKSVEKHLILDVQDMDVISEEFEKLFPEHVSEPSANAKKKPAQPAVATTVTKPTLTVAKSVPAPPVRTAPAPAPTPTRSAGGAEANRKLAPRPERTVPAAVLREASASADRIKQVFELAPVMRMLKLVTVELGEARAFEMFERWASDFLELEVRSMLDRIPDDISTPREFYDAAKEHFERFGERYVIVEETPDRIVHEIHSCMYQQACIRVGGINMDKWGTCMQVIPIVRSKAAAVADPGLEWVWNRCDRRSEQPCLYEIHKRVPEK